MPKHTVAGIGFERKEDVITELQRVLYSTPPGSDISENDDNIVAAILLLRRDKIEEIGGRRVVAYFCDGQPGPVKSTTCFYVRLDDGTTVDFSFMKAVELLQPGIDPLKSPVWDITP